MSYGLDEDLDGPPSDGRFQLLDPVTGARSPMSPSYGTPPEICAAVRDLLGGIDLDPATSQAFNAHVGAAQIFTEIENGIDQPWHGRVYLNPPGGKAKPRASAWWRKLFAEYLAGNVASAVYMSFALDSFQWSQAEGSLPILTFPTFVFAKRVKFYVETADGLVQTKAPTRPCAITWLPPVELEAPAIREIFSAFALDLNEAGHAGVAVYP